MLMIYGHSTMTDSKPPRGRPKGSGIDDRIWLREMERLMRLDPALRPTSAIKALGVTDPSAIRRLRDKYAARHAPSGAEQPRHRIAVQAAAKDPVLRQRVNGPRLVSRSTPPAAATPLPRPEPGPDAARDAVGTFWGLGFQTATLIAQYNLLTMLALARNPAAGFLLGQHIAVSEAVATGLRLQASLLAAAKR